jgi:hypothetical protein
LSSVPVISTVSGELLVQLETLFANSSDTYDLHVGALFLKRMDLFRVYKLFCLKTQVAISQLLRESKKNADIKRLLKEQEEAEECRMMGMEQFLMKPFQRITKYPLLFKVLLLLLCKDQE